MPVTSDPDRPFLPGSYPEATPGGETSYPDVPVDLALDHDLPTPQTKALRLVGRDRRVLELGCASGYMAEAMKARGCAVVGVELDAEAASAAEAHCERVLIGDLDQLDLEAELEGERFDVVLATDLLEHLKDPGRLLRAAAGMLSPGGELVVTVPNVAHGSVRLALLAGRFPYAERGLLDRTHLRFFTLETLDRLLEEAGFGVAEVLRHELPFEESEIGFPSTPAVTAAREALEGDREALAYQYIVRAVRLPSPELAAVQTRMRENAELIGELRSELGETRFELRAARAEIDFLRTRAEQAEEEVRAVTYRLNRMVGRFPFRTWYALQDLPGLRRLWRRRRARFESEVLAVRSPDEGG